MVSLRDLEKVLRPLQILTDADSLLKYGRDWTRAIEPKASAVLLPESTEEVKKIVEWARKNKISLVPSGGRTGLSAAAVASNQEVVVSLERMNNILKFSPIDQTITCEAGVVTEKLQDFVRDQGFYFPVDFASRGSSQIGGNISTNAGGIKVIRYGHMREWVLSLKVVTGTGEIIQASRDLVKDNSGYDLRHLYIGAEGTLGFITEATLKVTKPPQDLQIFLLAASKLSSAVEILARFRKVVPLTAFEFFTDKALQYVLKSTDLREPFSTKAKYYLLVEFENSAADTVEKAMEVFDAISEEGLVTDGAIAQNETQSRNFWKYRENISEAMSPHTPFKSDISVKVSKIPDFVEEAEKLFSQKFSGTEIVWFGHIGDGNLHLNVPKSGDDFVGFAKRMSEEIFSLIQKYEGSISAEHGIGLVKKPYLHFTRSKVELDFMRGIKKVFDPDGILNPGKIFD